MRPASNEHTAVSLADTLERVPRVVVVCTRGLAGRICSHGRSELARVRSRPVTVRVMGAAAGTAASEGTPRPSERRPGRIATPELLLRDCLLPELLRPVASAG